MFGVALCWVTAVNPRLAGKAKVKFVLYLIPLYIIKLKVSNTFIPIMVKNPTLEHIHLTSSSPCMTSLHSNGLMYQVSIENPAKYDKFTL